MTRYVSLSAAAAKGGGAAAAAGCWQHRARRAQDGAARGAAALGAGQALRRAGRDPGRPVPGASGARQACWKFVQWGRPRASCLTQSRSLGDKWHGCWRLYHAGHPLVDMCSNLLCRYCWRLIHTAAPSIWLRHSGRLQRLRSSCAWGRWSEGERDFHVLPVVYMQVWTGALTRRLSLAGAQRMHMSWSNGGRRWTLWRPG